MRRRVIHAVTAGLLLPGVLGACDGGTGGFVQPAPSLIGVRAEGERLELWTGTSCEEVTEIELTLDPGAEEPLAVVEYVADAPRTVDRFELGTAPAGFTARVPLPGGVSWRDAEDLLVVLTLADGSRSVTADLEPLMGATESAGDEPDEYLLGDRLLTEDELLDGDGDDYALVCSPDPTAE